MEILDKSSANSSLYQSSDTDWRVELPLSLLCDKENDEGLLQRKEEDLLAIFEKSVFLQGKDPLIWGHFLVCVYMDPDSNKFGSFFLDKLGVTHFPSVSLHENSVYYPAVLNLSSKHENSNVRKVLACSLLQKYATLDETTIKKITDGKPLKYDYDQTHAGDLANACKIVEYCTPGNLGKSLLLHGLIQPRSVQSLLVDVVYENKAESIDANNELVFYLGEQLEQLFDPLTEYSPEQTERVYTAPEYTPEEQPEKDEPLINSICQELLSLQTNFTLSMIEFLQKFLIPMRIDVLNEDIPGLSAVKLNRLFPPTIDEVTRINCIFLDALKSATPYGALEVLKACSITIPYCYKAYSRHEAATKNFSKDIKLFMQKFKQVIPKAYTEMRIETIIKGPQEKLMKIKLILERMWKCKRWSTPEVQKEAQKYFQSSLEIIDTFGKLDAASMSSYNTRVFTPSGKILTELAKGWPLELQYKWLKRRIVGVFDVIDVDNNNERNLVVIFSDYVVILNIIDSEKYYVESENKPLISDVLMNSLINEVALPPKIPKLKVVSHCYIDKVLTSTTKDNSITFTFLDSELPQGFVYKLASSKMRASQIEELCIKAKILEKVTAFHLFKSNRCNFNLYFTAHELEAYQNETIKSRNALFLNFEPDLKYIQDQNIDLAFFVRLLDGKVRLTRASSSGFSDDIELPFDELVNILTTELIDSYPVNSCSLQSPFYRDILKINEDLTRSLGHHFNLNCIHGPPSDALHAVKHDANNGFDAIHKKEKSYGTITTFRSSVSDLKVKSKSPQKQNNRLSSSGSQVCSPKSNLHPQTTKRNFLSRLFSVFRLAKISGRRKQKSTPVQKIEKPSHSASHATTPAVGPKKGERMGSVIHKKSVNVAISTAVDDNVSNSSSASLLRDKTSNVAQNSVASEQLDRRSVSDENQLYLQREEERQSQVFNNDLFGDLVDPSKSERIVTPVVKPRNNGNQDTRMLEITDADLDMVKELGHASTMSVSQDIHEVSSDGPSVTLDENNEKESGSTENTDQYVSPIIQDKTISKETDQKLSEKSSSVLPKVVKYELPKINFTKSPSFAELFQEMRMVLDDSDETANWRRLNSEISLNEKYKIKRTNEDQTIIQKQLPPQPEVSEKDILVRSDNATTYSRESNMRTPRVSTTFNVIKTSPVKIISTNTLTKKPSTYSADSSNEPSSIYAQSGENARLVELTFHSQEDLPEKPFYTPQTEPLENFERKSPHSTPKLSTYSTPNKNVSIESGNVTKNENVQAPLLEDIEFSFFHMSFDETNNTSTRESSNDTGEIFEKNCTVNPQVTEPVFYKFSNFTKSNESFFSCQEKVHAKAADMDDDPIWISPSKLEMFDISKKPELSNRALHQWGNKKTVHPTSIFDTFRKDTPSVVDEPSLLRDTSYGYLGNLVIDEDESKPTRLHFKA